MSKPKKHSSLPNIADLPTTAARFLAEGQYKKAIEAYKQLLKTETRQEWREGLATAYLERAKTLAAKMMYKEAAALWETRASLCQDESVLELYVLWLIYAGRYGQAARLYVAHKERLPASPTTAQLLPLLGAWLLAGQTEIADHFPVDTSLHQQYVIVKTAIQAYCQGQTEEVENYLTQIPFRSPYRDCRLLLKSLLRLPTEAAAAYKLLEKIPADSPYYHFTNLITSHAINIDELSKLSQVEQLWVANLNGWNQRQLKLVSQLSLLLSQASAQQRTLFDIIVEYQDLLGVEYAKRVGLAILPLAPTLTKDYQKTFGPLSPFEQKRVEALRWQQQSKFASADSCWKDAVAILKSEPDSAANALKIAFILRHRAYLAERYNDNCEDQVILNYWQESLDYDPSDKDTYLKVINLYQQRENRAKYHEWILLAVKQFPNNTEALTAAMESFVQRKAFKKAVEYAKAVLKLDPIHLKARQVLFSSHVSHARKLIKTKKFELARKELNEAAHYEKTNQPSGLVQINQGLLNWYEGTAPELAKPAILEGFKLAGGGLNGYLRVLVETKSLNLKLEDSVLPWLPKFTRQYVPTRSEILAVVALINSYQQQQLNQQQLKSLLKMLATLEVPLQQVPAQTFSKEEMISICECFKQIGHFGLLKAYSQQALSEWPAQPILVFYQLFAKALGKPYGLHLAEVQLLQEAAAQAEDCGDKRTHMIIMKFLTERTAYGMPKMIPMELLEELANLETDDEIDENEALSLTDSIQEMMEMLKQIGESHSSNKGGKKKRSKKK